MRGWIVYFVTDTGRSVEHWFAFTIDEAMRETSRLTHKGVTAYARRGASW
jgi:hypothetical protein